MPDVVREISKVRIPGVPEPYNFADLVARASASHSLQVSVVTASWITQHTPPSDSELGILFLVPHSGHEPGVNDAHDEYVAVKDESTTPATYTWEKIGTIDINLANYSLTTHRHTVTFNIGVEDHIFTPEGTVAIPNFDGTNSNFRGRTGRITVDLIGSSFGITVTVGSPTFSNPANYTPKIGRIPTLRTHSDGDHTHDIPSSSYIKSELITTTIRKPSTHTAPILITTAFVTDKILETIDVSTVTGVVSTNDLYLLSDPNPIEVCHAASSPTQVQNLSLTHDQASQITNHQTHDRADGTLGTAFDVSDADFLTKHETAVMHGVSVSGDGTMQFTFKPINTDDALDVLTHTEHDVPIATEETPIPFLQAVPYAEGENTVNDFTQEEQITSGIVARTSGDPVTVATGRLGNASGGGSGSPIISKRNDIQFQAYGSPATATGFTGYRPSNRGNIITTFSGSTDNPSSTHAHGTHENPGEEEWGLVLDSVGIIMKPENMKIRLSTPENGYTPHSVVDLGGGAMALDKIQIANVADFNSNFKGTTNTNSFQHNVNNALLETSEASDLMSEITVTGSERIDLPYAIRGGITEVTVYGQCKYEGDATPSVSRPIPIICNNGALDDDGGNVIIQAGSIQETVMDSCLPRNTANIPMLLSVGSGANLFRDEYNIITGEIIRRCEVFVYDGRQTLTTPRMSTTGSDTIGAIIVQKLETEIIETTTPQKLDAVSNTSLNTLSVLCEYFDNNEIQATYNFDPICDESVLTDSSVMNVVKHNNTNNLFYIDPDIYPHITIDTDVYTPMNYVLWGMTGDKKLYMYKNAMSARKWAESNKYKIVPDTTQSGSFHWKVTINGTVKQGDVSWSAGDTISSIVSQMTGTATYLTFTEDNGFIKVSVSTSTDSTFTLTNTSNVVLKDLSKNCKVNGVLMSETHRAWQTKKVETMFPDSVYESSSTVQYAINGYNLSYRCGANLPKFKSYFETSGTNHGGVDTYLPEDSTDARMSRAGFASCETGTTEAQTLFNKYHGSWDEYIEASMAKINDTHTTGIEYISRNNGESQSKFLANVLTLDFDETTWIPAYPQAAAAATIEFSGIGTGNLPTVHELLLFIDETKRVAINKALTNIGGTNISANTSYWTVGEFNFHYTWGYNAAQGTNNGGREKYISTPARVVCSSN